MSDGLGVSGVTSAQSIDPDDRATMPPELAEQLGDLAGG